MSQYIIHSIKPRSQHEHEGYYSPNLSYKPIIKFDGVVKVFPPDNAKNDTKHPVVRYDWKAYDKSGKLVKTYGSSISCDWRMLSDKVFIEKQIKGRDFSNGRFWYVDGEVSNTELAKAANAIQLALKEYAKSNPEFVAAPHPQHSGYYSPNLRHSDEDVDVIDCTGDEHLEHAYSASNSFVGNSNVNGPNSKVLRMSFDKSGSSLYDNKNGLYATLHFELNGGYGTNPNGTNAFGISVDYDPRYYNDLKHYERKVREQLSNKLLQNASTNEWTVSPLEITKAAQFTVDAFKRYRLSKAHSQHPGYYSPNLKHSESDYLSVKMSDIN